MITIASIERDLHLLDSCGQKNHLYCLSKFSALSLYSSHVHEQTATGDVNPTFCDRVRTVSRNTAIADGTGVYLSFTQSKLKEVSHQYNFVIVFSKPNN